MEEYYEYIDYISKQHLEECYVYELPDTLDEIRTTLGLKEPPVAFIRRYWANLVLEHWRQFWCLEWLYERSGRPQVEGLDIITTIECCKVHLEGCLMASYENCDLVETKHILSNCYCPKCYNDKLSGWRQADV
jgi:hypothetical protein